MESVHGAGRGVVIPPTPRWFDDGGEGEKEKRKGRKEVTVTWRPSNKRGRLFSEPRFAMTEEGGRRG